ncbi:MAG: hypothetical protein ABFS56_20900 [Pseudomonadota bacterium]
MPFNPFIALTTSVFLLVFMTACTPNEPSHENDLKLDEITITYLGGTTRFPINTTISIVNYAYPIISYSKKIIVPPHRLDDNAFETTWQTALQPQDFVYIEKRTEDLNIFTANELSDASPEKPCFGVSRVKLYVKSKRGQENTLTLSGAVLCQEKTFPTGFKKLIGEINALIPKYQPTLETRFAIWIPKTLKVWAG